MISDLNERLERHKKRLNDEEGGERIVLPNIELLMANLRGQDPEIADLRGANLQGAKLREANLCWTILENADLRGADLRDANLECADLQGANLQGANLRGAKLQGANLRWANLENARLPNFQKMPETGLVIGWKKVRGDILLMMEIMGQRTCTLNSRICRCSEAKVLEAFTSEGTQVQGITQFMSLRDNSFLYEIGKVVHVPNYDGDIRMMGAPGIHFFLTQQEAQNYYR